MKKKLTDKQRNSRANLIPFKKGKSGNPAGRKPNKKYLSDLLREYGKKVCKDDKDNLTYGEKLAKVMWDEAIKNKNPALINIILERMEGKLTQPISGDEDRPPIEILIRNINTKKLLK